MGVLKGGVAAVAIHNGGQTACHVCVANKELALIRRRANKIMAKTRL
jgi:hypothetical protein